MGDGRCDGADAALGAAYGGRGRPRLRARPRGGAAGGRCAGARPALRAAACSGASAWWARAAHGRCSRDGLCGELCGVPSDRGAALDLSSLDFVALFASLIVAATPLVLAAIGELVVEKSGVLNLGVEGMMIMGAVTGFILAVTTGIPLLGFVGAAIAGAALALVFGVLTQVLLSNQVATGLALTLFGLGLAALLGQSYTGIRPPQTASLDLPVLSDLPVLGRLLFSHDWVVYFALLLVGAVWWYLNRTRRGLILRAVGENHDAAHALGYRVVAIRLGAIAFGGACAGLGGAYLSLVRVPQWSEGMTAGIGWIALAIVVFASWKPSRVILGAWLFGGVTILQLNIQAANLNVLAILALVLGVVAAGLLIFNIRRLNGHLMIRSAFIGALGLLSWSLALSFPDFQLDSAYLSMTPYLTTIAVLVAISGDRTRAALNAPASLGRVFHASA
ncbi:ABC transporter permease [Pontivivens ytuae]|uniref:ABC transporter permease n=1 Tax=Pontivivens ytuae TaxID=2789856 RepID=A0A7S9LPM7_9RHOB|nr:ABC transporter permease [Pontivivens ytuae]